MSKPSKIRRPAGYVCVGCGKEAEDRQLFDVGCLAPILRACAICIGRYGRHHLRVEADRLLALFEAKEAEKLIPTHKKGKCWHCASPVLRDLSTGLYPMWCQACDRELKRIGNAGEAKTKLAQAGG